MKARDTKMADTQDEKNLNIFNRLTRGEFSKAWDGIVDMARMALTKNHRHENREALKEMIHDCIYAKGGDVSARARTVELGSVYLNLSKRGREIFHDILARDFDIDRQTLAERIKDLQEAGDGDKKISAEIDLKKALTPPRQVLLKQFSSLPNGFKFLIDMRADILPKTRHDQNLWKLSIDIKEILGAWFDIGLLDLQEITWNSPAALLEKLIEYEAVHAIRSWDDLRSRLDSDRLCFAFFHSKMISEPLIFVEVALVNKLSSSIQELLNKEDEKIEPEKANTAIFYSISNTQPGLAGINLGNFLIKTVVKKLSDDFSQIKQFATLSPVPGFRKWLSTKLANGEEDILLPKEIEAIKAAFKCENSARQFDKTLTTDWYNNIETAALSKPILIRLCARYLLQERKKDRALDQVANFHLANGARLERINWGADLSENGMQRSYGIMVNYYYKLSEIENNHEEYVTRTKIAASRSVRGLLKG
jgi:malonyl-CoA decarboxylase